MPSTSPGGSEKIYTLGSRGRDFLAGELGLPVEWYFRPAKLKHFSYSQVVHNLVLTRFLVSAHVWALKQPAFRLAQTRIGYDLASEAAMVTVGKGEKKEVVKVIPDAWLLFERLKNGRHEHYFPVLLEIDRGMEHQQRFKQHVRSRVEFIKKGGGYSKLFGTEAVMIAYATTGQTPEYRETRRRALCAWTKEVLTELGKAGWAPVFRFHSLCLEEIYKTPIFEAPLWYRPDLPSPMPLLTP
jgi:hypothetical protein